MMSFLSTSVYIYAHMCVYELFFFKAMPFKILFQYHFDSSLVNTFKYQLLTSTKGLAVMSAGSGLGFLRSFRED